MKQFVLAAIQELSRHDTKEQADAELDLYEATTEITYVVLRLPDPPGKVAKTDSGAGAVRRGVAGGKRKSRRSRP
jgi:hypothetical protein